MMKLTKNMTPFVTSGAVAAIRWGFRTSEASEHSPNARSGRSKRVGCTRTRGSTSSEMNQPAATTATSTR